MSIISDFFRRSVSAATTVMLILVSIILLLRIFGLKAYIVKSGSMEPTIGTGSIAVVDLWNRAGEEGDIVIFHSGDDQGGQLVTHRIVREHWDGHFTTKGDANECEDAGSLYRDSIVGTYLFQIPRAGYLAAEVGSRGAVMVILWVAGLNILAAALEIK